MAVQNNWGPPSIAGSIDSGVETILGGIKDYQTGQLLDRLPKTADGGVDYRAAAQAMYRTNPGLAVQFLKMEELKQRESYQDRYLKNQERQTDIAADKSTNIQAEGKIFHIGPNGQLKGTTDIETGVYSPAGAAAPAAAAAPQQPASPVNSGVGKQPKPEHLQILQADPSKAGLFDEVYGPGSAQRYLAGGGPADPRQAAAAPAQPAPLPPLPPNLSYSEKKEARKGQIKERVTVDQPELKKADDAVQSGRNTLLTLAEMQKLNQTAFDKPTAGIRGTIASVTGIGGKQAGVDTVLLQNKIVGGALEQLRATFGGNPTEGERAILIQVQGSVNQAREVREQIFKDAAELVRRRIKFNQKYAAAQRAGTYLNPEFTDNTPVD